MVSTIEAFDNETRKYTEVKGESVDESFKVLTLEKFLPDKIWYMFRTADHTTYLACKYYATKLARGINKGKAAIEPAASAQPSTRR